MFLSGSKIPQERATSGSGLELVLFLALEIPPQWTWTRMSPHLAVPPIPCYSHYSSNFSCWVYIAITLVIPWSLKGLNSREEDPTELGLVHSAIRPWLPNQIHRHNIAYQKVFTSISKLNSIFYEPCAESSSLDTITPDLHRQQIQPQGLMFRVAIKVQWLCRAAPKVRFKLSALQTPKR